jgi:Ca2+-binding RTX toxin-like protein
MAIFTKTVGNSITGTFETDFILVDSAADYAGGTIDGEANWDELRYATSLAETLVLDAGTINIESFVIGTGSGGLADTSGTNSASIDASALLYGATFAGNSGDNTLIGTGFADSLNGGAGNDFLEGRDGDDILDGGTGNNLLDGGAGSDTASYALVTEPLNIQLPDQGDLVVVLGDRQDLLRDIENLTSGAGDDWLIGNQATNTLIGNAGHDHLEGRAGDDFLDGGTGNNVLDGGAGSDTASYASVTESLNIQLPEQGDFLVVLGDRQDLLRDIENLIGGAFDDELHGNAQDNRLDGGGGNDSLWGEAGDDLLEGDAGDDHLFGWTGNDSLAGGDGNDHLFGDTGNDSFEGGAGDDWLDGSDGIDTVSYATAAVGVLVNLGAGYAEDALGWDPAGIGYDGFYGIENVIGGAFDDQIFGDWNDNLLIGGAGNDYLYGGSGFDTVSYATAPTAIEVDANYGAGWVRPIDWWWNPEPSSIGWDDLYDIENIIGGAGDDLFRGGSEYTLNGSTGYDTFRVYGPAADYRIGSDATGRLTLTRFDGTLAGTAAGLQSLQFDDRTVGIDTTIKPSDPLNSAQNPALAGLADGGFVMAWEVWDQNSGDADVYAQRYDAAGRALGGEFRVNTSIAGAQHNASVIALWNGGFRVSWESDPGQWLSQDYDATGQPVGGENGTPWYGTNQSVATFGAQGGYVAVWEEWGQSGLDIRAQYFNPAAAPPASPSFLVNSSTEFNQKNPAVSAWADGGFVAVWQSEQNGPNGWSSSISGQSYDERGNPLGGEFQVLSGDPGTAWWEDIEVAALADGGFVVIWSAPDTLYLDDRIFGQRYDAAGNPLGSSFRVAADPALATDQHTPAITALTDGGFVVAWQFWNPASSSLDIRAQRYDALGNEVGAANTLTGLEWENDTLFAGAGDQILRGLSGDDILDGGAGDDSLDGGDGIDTASYASALAGVTVDLLLPGTAGGGAGDDRLTGIEIIIGGDFDDVLIGNADHNEFHGGGGNDLLVGGAEFDLLYGEAGDADTVSYASAGGGVKVDLEGNYAQDRDGSNPIPIGYDFLSGIENAVGSPFDDELKGDWNANFLDGGTGNDTLVGNSGNDTLVGGDGDDSLDGDLWGYGDDSLDGGAGNDNLVSGTGDDSLNGGYGFDTLDGGPGNDSLIGGDGDDSLNGDLWDDGNDSLDGGAGNDSLDGGDGNDNLDGGAGDDSLNGGYGFDTLAGGEGNDSLDGGESSDNLDGGDGDDSLDGGNGHDSLNGGLGNDTLVGGADFDQIDGGAGNADAVSYASAGEGVEVDLNQGQAYDREWWNPPSIDFDTLTNIENVIGSPFDDDLTGDGNANRLDGGDGRDTLEGGAGNDTLVGGTGLDTAAYREAGTGVTISLALAAAQNTVGAGTDTLSGIESLLGSAFNDRLTGNGGNNILEGGWGNDSLYGNAGLDTASYALANSGVTVSLALTGAQDTGGAGTDTLSSIENLTGGAFDDLLTGNGAANVLDGGTGHDSLDGGSGNDLLDGGAGDDLLNGNTGTDTASYASAEAGVTVNLNLAGTQDTGGAGLDTLTAIENLTGSAHADTLTGNTAANTLSGGAGHDSLDGGSGNDLLDGGPGDDLLNGGTGTDTVSYASAGAGVTVNLNLAGAQDTGGAGFDTLVAIESLTGSAQADTLLGNAVANTLAGGDGADSLAGGAGNDVLRGGAGADSLVGGLGADKFDYDALLDSLVGSPDLISDFVSAQIDKLDLSTLDANLALAGNQAFSFIGNATFSAAGQVRYDAAAGLVQANVDAALGADLEIQLVGVGSLAATDFVL